MKGESLKAPIRRAGRTMLLVLLLGGALSAGAAEEDTTRAPYDPQRAGHPLRIVAYVLHPVGVTLDYLIFRPAYWIGSFEPLKTLFGRTD